MEKEFKLTIELVPSTLWYINLRTAMGQKKWDVLRKSVYAQYNYQCGICEAQQRLAAHERWAYEGEGFQRTQCLLGFIALCSLCHHCKHIGLAGNLAKEGKLNMEDVVAHFMRVNGCTREEYEQHYEEQFRIWRERSNPSIDWELDYGQYQEYAMDRKEYYGS